MFYLVHAGGGGGLRRALGQSPGGIKGMKRSETVGRMVEAGWGEADAGNYICVNLSGGLRKLCENKDVMSFWFHPSLCLLSSTANG